MADLLNCRFSIHLPFKVVSIKAGIRKHFQTVRAVSTHMQDQRAFDGAGQFLVDGQKILLIVTRADQISGGVIRHHHDVRPGLELGPGGSQGGRHELPDHAVHHFFFFDADLEQEILGAGHVVGKGPGSHHFSDDGRFSAHISTQDGKSVKENTYGWFFQKIIRNDHIRKILVGKVSGIRHAVSVAPIHITAEGGRFLINTVLRHNRIKPDYFMPRERQFRHGLWLQMGFGK